VKGKEGKRASEGFPLFSFTHSPARACWIYASFDELDLCEGKIHFVLMLEDG
jgi:hypothetical protein